jgi:hypothetical protein
MFEANAVHILHSVSQGDNSTQPVARQTLAYSFDTMLNLEMA